MAQTTPVARLRYLTTGKTIPALLQQLRHLRARLLHASNVNVNAELERRGFEVFAVDYDMFALGGGGVHCSCHELFRESD